MENYFEYKGVYFRMGTIERHFLTLWQLIGFLSGIDENQQKN